MTIGACSSRNPEAIHILETADAMMMSQPEVALDTLRSIDAKSACKLSPRDKAFFTLLLTEAEYKCYLPIHKDTAIFQAVNYYHRHGPDNRFARALVMQGAVHQERGDASSALESYKKAEPIMERLGDAEQIGLLNTKIGALYQDTFTNVEEAAYRYAQALKYFKTADNEQRQVRAELSLGQILLNISVDSSYVHISRGLALARKLGDEAALLDGYEMLIHNYGLQHNYQAVLETSRDALKYFSDIPNDSLSIISLNNILIRQILAYTALGMPDSAQNAYHNIQWQETAEDTVLKHWTLSEIAAAEGDWREAFVQHDISSKLTDSIKTVGYEAQLRLQELQIDRQALDARNRQTLQQRNLIISISSFAILLITAFSLALYGKHKRIKENYENLLASFNLSSRSEIQAVGKSLVAEIPDTPCGEKTKKDIYSLLQGMLNMISEMDDVYFRYGRSSIALQNHFDAVLKKYMPEGETYDIIRDLCDILYPGVIKDIESSHPSLTKNDLLLIALMGCGFPTGAICAIKRMTVGSLNSQKTRTARKIGSDVRLSEYISQKFSKK